MAQKLPLKKIPSTHANPTKRSANLAEGDSIHFIAQSAFFFTVGIV
jgi:hypothetical protein